jgi:hypothetical protein
VNAKHPQAAVLELELEEPGYGAVVFDDKDTCPWLHLSFFSPPVSDILLALLCGGRKQ